MKQTNKPMRYGNASDMLTRCPRCNESPDRHRIEIVSDERSEAIARKLQAALDQVSSSAALKGWSAPRVACMVGAAIARIGSADYRFAAISGFETEILGMIKGKPLGKDVVLVADRDARPLATIDGSALVVAQPVAGGRNRDYPVGACAAQKLLMAIFRKRQEVGGGIASINMSEILWSDPQQRGHNRDWSTGSVVCSCDTCKRVVPQMLCYHAE